MKILKTLAFSSLLVISATTLAATTMIVKPNAAAVGSGGGWDWCNMQYPGDTVCIPVANMTTDVNLNVAFSDFNPKDVQPDYVLTLQGSGSISQISVVVKNDKTGKQIYSGVAKNMQGLSCSDTVCTPWN